MAQPELMKVRAYDADSTLDEGVFLSPVDSDMSTGAEIRAVDDRVKVYTEYNINSDTVVYVFAGYRQRIQSVKNVIHPFLKDAGTVRYFGWPEDVYSDASLEDALLESADEDDGMQMKFVGISNGGKEGLYQFSKSDVQAAFPNIVSMNFESSPGDRSDIRGLYRTILNAGEKLDPESAFCRKLFAVMTKIGLSKSIHHSEAIPPELVHAVARATASTPLGPSLSQLESLSRPLPRDGSLARLGLQVGELNYFGSLNDPVVKLKASHARIESLLEHPVNFIKEARGSKSHAGITEHPELFAKILQYGFLEVSERRDLLKV